MRVLVVGGNSFIGARLVEKLRQAGHEVLFTTRSICNLLDLPQKLPSADIVYICAAMTKAFECERKPAQAHRINADAPRAIADLVHPAKIVFLSTDAVEDASRTIYGETKWRAEIKLDRYDPVIVRLSKVIPQMLDDCCDRLIEMRNAKPGMYHWP